MTLLLAFFIILQAFASVQSAGLFYAGRGSFIRALETFGLGGVLGEGGPLRKGFPSARYRSAEGQEEAPQERRIDPEAEEAQRALKALERDFDVRRPTHASGWRVTLPTPSSYRADKQALSPEEKHFCRELSRRLVPLLLARKFIIRVGCTLAHGGEAEAEHTRQALRAAGLLRDELIRSMPPRARQVAEERVYSFCSCPTAGAEEGMPPPQVLRVDILLTKPYIAQLTQERTSESETQTE